MACRTYSEHELLRDYDSRKGHAVLDEIAAEKRAPGMVGCFSDRGIYAHDEQVYREHNITHTDVVATEGGGRVRRAPAPKGGGCTCGNCAAHCKRAAVTGVASPGKEI